MELVLGCGAGHLGRTAGESLGFGEQFGLIFFQREHPLQLQLFHLLDKVASQIERIGHQHIQKPTPQLSVQFLQQGQRARHFVFPLPLKAEAQGNGEVRAHQHHGHDAVVILRVLADLAVDFVFDLALHAGVAAAEKGTADLDAVDRRHQAPARPVGVQHAITLQTPGHFTTQGEDGGRVLALERVAQGVLAELANPLPQDPPPAFGLQAMQVGNLDRSAQETRSRTPWAKDERETAGLPAGRPRGPTNRRPYPDRFRTGAAASVRLLYFSCSVGFLSRNQRRRFKAVIIAAAF